MMGMCQKMMGNMMGGQKNGMMGNMGPLQGMNSGPDKLLSAMSVEERIAFAAELLPAYGKVLFKGLRAEDKLKLSQALVRQLEATFDMLLAAQEDDCFMGDMAKVESTSCC